MTTDNLQHLRTHYQSLELDRVKFNHLVPVRLYQIVSAKDLARARDIHYVSIAVVPYAPCRGRHNHICRCCQWGTEPLSRRPWAWARQCGLYIVIGPAWNLQRGSSLHAITVTSPCKRYNIAFCYMYERTWLVKKSRTNFNDTRNFTWEKLFSPVWLNTCGFVFS